MGGNATFARDLWRNLGPKGQLGVVASALLVVVTMFFLYRTAAKPSYSTLLSGLDPAESSQIGEALDSGGVRWQLKNGGTELAVGSGQESTARVALAKKGLPNGGHVGFELFDKQSFGATDFQQRVNYQRALEGEISRTIESIEGVSSAEVQLVLPDDSLFADESVPATAAVLLSGGAGLDSSTVNGIAHLVSSSVKRLQPSDVTVTDDTGRLLWPRGDGLGGPGGLTKMEAEQRYDAQLSAQINSMLTQTLGVGKAQARVHSNLNLDRSTVDTVTFAKAGTPISAKTEEEGLKSQGGAAAAKPAGTVSNIPSGVGGTDARSSDYKRASESTEYGVDKKVERRIVAPGAVNKLDVALLVDSSVPEAQVTALKGSVAALAGVDAARGDTLAVSRIAFAKQPVPTAPKASPVPAGAMGALKWVALIVALGGFFFIVRKNLARREREPITVEPTWLREIEHGVPIGELEAAVHKPRNPSNARAEVLRDQVEEIARKQPEQVAIQVGQWMKEG